MTQTAPAGWYTDPDNPSQQRYWDGDAWTQNVAPTSPSEDAPQDLASPDSTAQPVVDAPVLQTWKTSVGLSVLGLLVGFPLLMILSTLVALVPMALTGLDSTQRGSGGPEIVGLVGNLFMLVYAVAIYPSYFSEKPRLRSSKAISFANFMFGGLIYGSLWNHNLSKRTKGISYIVSAVFSGLMCLWLALGILGALLAGVASSSASNAGGPSSVATAPVIQKSVQPLERTKSALVYTDAETGASFVIPNAWTRVPLREPRKTLDTKFAVSDSTDAMYGNVDFWSLLSENEKRGKTKADFQSMADLANNDALGLGSSGPEKTVRRMVLNGVEYYAVSLSGSANGQELRTVMLVRLENGRLYSFQYLSTPAGLSAGLDDPSLQTFYSMVASMNYPKK